MTMTDARLAAAVEAAARAHCRRYCGLADDEPDIWPQHRPNVRDMHEADVEHIVAAALAAADAWDREHGHFRVHSITNMQVTETGDDTQPYRFDWLTRLGEDQNATQEPQKPPLDGRTGSGGTPGPQVGDEGSGGRNA